MPCTKIKIKFTDIHVITSEEYGIFAEPGSTAEWFVKIFILVDGEHKDSVSWINDYTRDNHTYTIGQERVIGIPSDSSLITLQAFGEEIDNLTWYDTLPLSSVILSAGENWKIDTGGVLKASTGDYNYEIFFTVNCLAATAAAPTATGVPLPKKEPIKLSNPCFIATATYGSPLAPEVAAFRQFRDEVLAASRLGRRLVKIYYFVSPPLAALVKKSGPLRAAARLLLNSVLRLLRLARK